MAIITKRRLLIGTAALGGGLAVGYFWMRRPFPSPLAKPGRLAAGEIALNPYIVIGGDGRISLVTPRAEMGQGAQTGMAQLIAEELDVALDAVRVVHGPADRGYLNWAITRLAIPFGQDGEGMAGAVHNALLPVVGKLTGHQITGGSSSIPDAFDSLRRAGATARAMLIAAAAAQTKLAPDKLKTENGHVIAGNERIPYGKLAAAAARLSPPSTVALKPRSEWRLIGKSAPRVDLREKVTGAPIYGVDVVLPNMLYGTVRMTPRFGGAMADLSDAKARSMPGVVAVVDLSDKHASGFGVIASDTWTAFEAANAVTQRWLPANPSLSSADHKKRLADALAKGGGNKFRNEGDAASAIAAAKAGGRPVIEAEYYAPFLAHTAMEPLNATALWDKGKVTLWIPTQIPTLLIEMVKREFGVPAENVEVVTTFLGGGFGRRLELEEARYAVKLARKVEGRPIKVTWSRAEDTTHDVYRPAALSRWQGALGPDGLPTAISGRIAAPSVAKAFIGRILPDLPAAGPDKLMVEGSHDQPYALPNYYVEGIETDLDIPVGNWRSVGYSFNSFFHETFLDELARAGKQDPVALRLKLLAKQPGDAKVVEKAAAMAGWGKPRAKGTGLGFASTRSFGSMCAQVVEVEQVAGQIAVRRVWAAIDVGTAVNPELVRRQVESAIVYGLSAAIMQEITVRDGMVEQTNFHDFDALRIHQCPVMEVAVLEGQPRVGGAGEPGLPPVIPALGNAIFDLTGQRLRSMPFNKALAFV
jgi:isoquinoline 1-oxidoreductase beta subunit